MTLWAYKEKIYIGVFYGGYMTELSFRKEARRARIWITILMLFTGFVLLIYTQVGGSRDVGTFSDLSNSWYNTGNFGVADEPLSGELLLHKDSVYPVLIKLPEDIEIKSKSCITFISYACAFDVIVDGRIIYSYGKDRLSDNKMIPRMVHYVSIPTDAADRNVKIIFISGKNGASIYPGDSYFGNIETLTGIFTHRRGYGFLLCGFLITFGVLLVVLSLLGYGGSISLASVAQGFLIFDLGIYIAGYNDMISYIIRDAVICPFVEYISLMSLPLFMQTVILTNHIKYSGKLHLLVAFFDFAIIPVAIILHATDIRHINSYAPFIHGIMIIQGLYTFIWVNNILRRERRSSHSYLYADAAIDTIDYGIITLLLTSLLNLFVWNLGVNSAPLPLSDVKGNLMLLGAMVFSGSVILAYLFHSLGTEHDQEIRATLTEAAYTDELTGIRNRAHCDRLSAKYDAEGFRGGVIALDLDGLKKINDTIGHEAGDRYIITFAQMLRNTLPEDMRDNVCRMGGDEFFILLKGYSRDEVIDFIDKLQHTADEYNKSHPSFPVLYSVGMACSEELEGQELDEYYRLSDKRMYDMKDEHHKQGKGGRA